MWSPFVDLGIRSPIFLHPKTAIFSNFGCKKKGLRMPKSKYGDHFLSPTIPKTGGTDSCFTWISFLGEFWANFENRIFQAHCKTPKSKTYGAIAQIKSLKSSNGCFGLLIHKGTGCEVGRAQKNIFVFSGHPTGDPSKIYDAVVNHEWDIGLVRGTLLHPCCSQKLLSHYPAHCYFCHCLWMLTLSSVFVFVPFIVLFVFSRFHLNMWLSPMFCCLLCVKTSIEK